MRVQNPRSDGPVHEVAVSIGFLGLWDEGDEHSSSTQVPGLMENQGAHFFPGAFLKEGTSETEQDPVGFLSTDGFLCPPFLVYREHTQAPMTFPEFKGKFKQLLIRRGKGCGTKKKTAKRQ